MAEKHISMSWPSMQRIAAQFTEFLRTQTNVWCRDKKKVFCSSGNKVPVRRILSLMGQRTKARPQKGAETNTVSRNRVLIALERLRHLRNDKQEAPKGVSRSKLSAGKSPIFREVFQAAAALRL
jgi:hypothetical protein